MLISFSISICTVDARCQLGTPLAISTAKTFFFSFFECLRTSGGSFLHNTGEQLDLRCPFFSDFEFLAKGVVLCFIALKKQHLGGTKRPGFVLFAGFVWISSGEYVFVFAIWRKL